MKQILIIPDTHGRKFWRNPVQKHLNDPDTHIVFLGDYLDPYRDIDNITAEEAFEELEAIITTLDNPELSLEEAFAAYKDGMELLKHCNASIDAVEKKVKAMNEEGELYEF